MSDNEITIAEKPKETKKVLGSKRLTEISQQAKSVTKKLKEPVLILDNGYNENQDLDQTLLYVLGVAAVLGTVLVYKTTEDDEVAAPETHDEPKEVETKMRSLD